MPSFKLLLVADQFCIAVVVLCYEYNFWSLRDWQWGTKCFWMRKKQILVVKIMSSVGPIRPAGSVYMWPSWSICWWKQLQEVCIQDGFHGWGAVWECCSRRHPWSGQSPSIILMRASVKSTDTWHSIRLVNTALSNAWHDCYPCAMHILALPNRSKFSFIGYKKWEIVCA